MAVCPSPVPFASAPAHARKAPPRRERLLAVYTDPVGTRHELLALSGAASSTLVVDRSESPLTVARLVAHLMSEEPPENALIVCQDYLPRARAGTCRCRTLEPDDLRRPPAPEEHEHAGTSAELVSVPHPRPNAGQTFALAAQPVAGSLPQLRWWRLGASECGAHAPEGVRPSGPLSLREAVGALEDYEPLRTMTRAAIKCAQPGDGLSRTVLRAELGRVQRSPIILNRALRDAVLASVRRGELSMSEIAIRCGRVKHDARGNQSGETSWLARRVGLLPEGGESAPTPWVHSAVLGLIARRGLGLAPREVEI